MASGPYYDRRRGTWSVQWKDGAKWRRVVVVNRKEGWKPGDPVPKKPPREAKLALAEFARRELTTRNAGCMATQTVSAFLAEYERQRALDRRPATLESLRRAIKDFIDWCDSKKVQYLHQVTPVVCQQFANHWRSNGRGIAYVKTQKALLAPAWRRAARLGMLSNNPWPAVEIAGKHVPKQHAAWTPEEFARLVAASPPWLIDVLTLGCHSGLRIKALLGLRWQHIAWAEEPSDDFGDIVVPPELDKAGVGYKVPIHHKAHDVLARRAAARTDAHDYVLVNNVGEPVPGDTSTYSAIRAVSVRAGLGLPVSPNHAMRRTFGRWAVLGHLTGLPIDIYIVSRWMGHHSIAMTERYLDLDFRTSREAMRDKRRDRTAPAESGSEPAVGDLTFCEVIDVSAAATLRFP